MRRDPIADTTWPTQPILPEPWAHAARLRRIPHAHRDTAYRWVQAQEDAGRYFVTARAAAQAWMAEQMRRVHENAARPPERTSGEAG